MAILVIFTGPGVDKSRYEELRKEVDWEHRPPAGVVFQAAGFDKTGIRVADVWESQQALDDFLNKRLLPALRKLKIPAPQVDIYPAYSLNAYPAVDRFKAEQFARPPAGR